MARSRLHRSDVDKSLVGFMVGEVAYAVPISVVREIVNPLVLTELPHLPPAVAGVADHRGEVVPVVDLRARFGLPALGADGRVVEGGPEEGGAVARRKAKWILVHVRERLIGLAVDSVTDVFGVSANALRPAPLLGGDDVARGVEAVVSVGGVLTFVLAVSRFEDIVTHLDPSLLKARLSSSRPLRGSGVP